MQNGKRVSQNKAVYMHVRLYYSLAFTGTSQFIVAHVLLIHLYAMRVCQVLWKKESAILSGISILCKALLLC